MAINLMYYGLSVYVYMCVVCDTHTLYIYLDPLVVAVHRAEAGQVPRGSRAGWFLRRSHML